MSYLATEGAYDLRAVPGMEAEGDAVRLCIASCLQCALVCQTAITYCQNLGGDHAAPHHLGLLMDCEDVSGAAARLMMRGSPRFRYVCNACARICADCAEDCERRANGDATIMACSRACREAARCCETLADANANRVSLL